jgi:hypothetical protein
MRRITVFGHDSTWSFAPGAESTDSWRSAFKATQAAVAYGDSLEGDALGYIVRLLLPGDDTRETFALETRVFDPNPVRASLAPSRSTSG